MTYDPLKLAINPTYRPALGTQDRMIVLYGGADSGKSYFAGGQLLPLWHTTQSGHKTLVVRKVANTLRNSVYAELVDGIHAMGWEEQFRFTSSQLGITNIHNGNQLLFAGLDDVNKLKSIHGITSIWVEEADEIAETDFWQLLMRIRGQEALAHMILTFNPVSEDSWTKALFFDAPRHPLTGAARGWRVQVAEGLWATVLHTTYHDNRFLPPERAAVLEAMKERSPNFYRIYALGEYGHTGDLVMENWETGDVSTAPDREHTGLDWGFAADPLAWVRVALDRRKHTVYVLDELYLFHISLHNAAELLQEKAGTQTIVCDSAEPRSIAELREYGLRAHPAKKGKGSLATGLRFLQGLKWVVAPRCVHMALELRNLRWRRDSQGNITHDTTGNDHLIDAVRYALESEIGVGKGGFVGVKGV